MGFLLSLLFFSSPKQLYSSCLVIESNKMKTFNWSRYKKWLAKHKISSDLGYPLKEFRNWQFNDNGTIEFDITMCPECFKKIKNLLPDNVAIKRVAEK
jgi:hypothetical protein